MQQQQNGIEGPKPTGWHLPPDAFLSVLLIGKVVVMPRPAKATPEEDDKNAMINITQMRFTFDLGKSELSVIT